MKFLRSRVKSKEKENRAEKRKIDIASLRRIVQIFFFLLLVYGGFLYLSQVKTALLPFVQNSTDVKKINALEAPAGYTEIFDTYMPFRTCRYVGGNRIFRACAVHFLTEVPAYGVPLYDFVPHAFVIVLSSFIFGRFFCGWVCPLGFTSDFFGMIRKWLRLDRLRLSERIMAIIKKLRVAWVAALFILAVAIAVPFIGLSAFKKELFLISCQTCPARNLFPLISGYKPGWFPFDNPISALFSIIGIIFIIMLIMGFFGKRIWCRFCPNGIMMSWFNKGCLVTKEKDVRKCTRCGICKRVCTMDSTAVYDEKEKKTTNAADCINCFTCVNSCPEEGCLKAKIAGYTLFESSYKPGHASPAKTDTTPIKSKTYLRNKKAEDNKENKKEDKNET